MVSAMNSVLCFVYAPRGSNVRATGRGGVRRSTTPREENARPRHASSLILVGPPSRHLGSGATGGRMRRRIFAALLILHGLAHAAPGMWAAESAPSWVVMPLWGAALLGYLGAGLGLLRLPVLRRFWVQLLILASASSILMLTIFAERVGLF